MSHVLLDAIVFTNDYQRGVQRYFRHLLEAMAGRAELDFWHERPLVTELPAGCTVVDSSQQKYVPAWNLAARRRRKAQWRELERRRAGYQVFHSTFFTRSPVPGLPEVVTVHDMIVERFPYVAGLGAAEQCLQKRAAIEHGRLFLTVSQTTADDLAALYPQTAGRIRVTYPGLDHLPQMAAAGRDERAAAGLARQYGLTTPAYGLFVGDRAGYKNFAMVPQAMQTPQWPKDLGLLVAGPALAAHEEMWWDQQGLRGRMAHVGRVDDATLGELYRQATALVCPSLLEGFGFPPLEAQRAETPVLCSDVPIFQDRKSVV